MCNNHAEVMQQQQIQPANIKPTVQYKDNIHVLEHTNINNTSIKTNRRYTTGVAVVTDALK